jgi:maleylpyruvate isomerase
LGGDEPEGSWHLRPQVTVRIMDERELNRDVEGAAAAHQRLLFDLDALDPTSALSDPARPTKLAGWTLGHILTHIARQADSVVRMLDGQTQYEGGAQGRSAEIESGATRGLNALVTDVRMSIWRLESRWAAHQDWQAPATLVSGAVVACHELPFRRWREVSIHHVDLEIGMGFEDLPSEYVRRELRLMEMLWNSRQPMGLTGLPVQALTLPPPQRLAWLMGRAEVEGLEPAGIY